MPPSFSLCSETVVGAIAMFHRWTIMAGALGWDPRFLVDPSRHF
jgi:hypothetical protein